MSKIPKDWQWPLKYFKTEEVLSPAGLYILETFGTLMMQSFFLVCLDMFRGKIGRPIYVNFGNLKLRGYRSPEENQTIDNYTQYSRHVQGIASDITIKGLSVPEMAEAAEKFGFTYVKPYPDNNFVHVDMRTTVATFKKLR